MEFYRSQSIRNKSDKIKLSPVKLKNQTRFKDECVHYSKAQKERGYSRWLLRVLSQVTLQDTREQHVFLVGYNLFLDCRWNWEIMTSQFSRCTSNWARFTFLRSKKDRISQVASRLDLVDKHRIILQVQPPQCPSALW